MTYQTVYLPTFDNDDIHKGRRPRGEHKRPITPNHQAGRGDHTGSLLRALFRIHVLVPCAALCRHASPLRGGRVFRVRVLCSILRISRATFPGGDQARQAYLILKPVLIIVIIVIEILEIIVVLKVLKFEGTASKVVNRTGNDLAQSGP